MSDRTLAELEGCTIHQGSALMISVAFGLEDLAVLEQLREVAGSFHITECLELGNLHGLANLERSKELFLMNLHTLRDLSGLDGLRSLENLAILRMFGLESLEGLQQLESVDGFLVLREIDRLESVDGLGGLRKVGGLQLENNKALRSLRGLSKLQTIGPGGLRLWKNPELSRAEIDAFLARVEIEGPVRIEDSLP